MDARERHFGPVGTGEGDELAVDAGAVVRRLILFEECTVESNRLQEIPALVSVFGVSGLVTLLESGVMKLICDALSVGSVGNLSRRNRPKPLPPGSYNLASVSLPREQEHRRSYLSDALQNVRAIPLPRREGQRLRRVLAERALTYPIEPANLAVAETVREVVQGQPRIGAAIRNVVQHDAGYNLDRPAEFEAYEIGENSVRIVTSLGRTVGVDSATEHRLVERALLAAARVNLRLGLMEALNAMTGFQAGEAPLFEDKLTFLMRQLDPTLQEDRFDRVVAVAGLPSLADLEPGTTVDVERLLELRTRSAASFGHGCEALKRSPTTKSVISYPP